MRTNKIIKKTRLKLINKIEHALALMIYDGHTEMASKLIQVLEAIYDKNYVMAVILCELLNLPVDFTSVVRNTFNVKKVA